MSNGFCPALATITGGLLALGLAACGDQTPVEPTADGVSPSFAAHAERTEVNMGLKAARAATAPYHRLEAAKDDGYVRITPCVADPEGPGAMGFHYANPALIDGTPEADAPEVLVYAPWRDGELRLVAVEWLVHSESEPEPFLGHHFHPVPEEPDTWGLHAWIWQNNPDGMFADFNPRLSCEGQNPA